MHRLPHLPKGGPAWGTVMQVGWTEAPRITVTPCCDSAPTYIFSNESENAVTRLSKTGHREHKIAHWGYCRHQPYLDITSSRADALNARANVQIREEKQYSRVGIFASAFGPFLLVPAV